MRRRDVLSLLGGAAVSWPLGARAQQPAMPVIGVLGMENVSMASFRDGLNEVGFVERKNVGVEYRWAEGQYDRLPWLAAELVGMRIVVLAAIGGDVIALAARAATATVPIVFAIGGDPIKLGLVASYNRPGGNVTGATWFTGSLAAKRLGLLRDLLPKATLIGVLVNPNNARADFETKDALEASHALGQQLLVLKADSESTIEAAFVTLAEKQAAALVVVGDAFFSSRHEQLVALAAHYAVPAIYSHRRFTLAGGLMNYGGIFADAYRQAGISPFRLGCWRLPTRSSSKNG